MITMLGKVTSIRTFGRRMAHRYALVFNSIHPCRMSTRLLSVSIMAARCLWHLGPSLDATSITSLSERMTRFGFGPCGFRKAVAPGSQAITGLMSKAISGRLNGPKEPLGGPKHRLGEMSTSLWILSSSLTILCLCFI